MKIGIQALEYAYQNFIPVIEFCIYIDFSIMKRLWTYLFQHF